MKSKSIALALMMLSCTIGSPAAFADDRQVSRGELAFHSSCGACHSLEKGRNLIGPSLYRVYERKAGTVPGYAYSEALKRLGAKWTADRLFPYLANTQSVAPGNKMWARFPSPQLRNDIIAYLASNSASRK